MWEIYILEPLQTIRRMTSSKTIFNADSMRKYSDTHIAILLYLNSTKNLFSSKPFLYVSNKFYISFILAHIQKFLSMWKISKKIGTNIRNFIRLSKTEAHDWIILTFFRKTIFLICVKIWITFHLQFEIIINVVYSYIYTSNEKM